MRRRWGPIVTGLALVLTFGILVGLGTLGPSGDPDGAAATAAPPDWMRPLRPGEKPPQFVLFSFDGAGSHEHWRRILPLAKKVNAHVTGFLSGIYLLPDSQRAQYTAPGHAPGHAAINFGGSEQEVDTRIADLNDAIDAGHEIGTHYNGHFCTGNEPGGAQWTTAQWNDELGQFFDFVGDAVSHGLQVTENSIKGGRTPCQEDKFAALAPALRAHRMTYDASATSDGVAWPQQRDGIWEFPVPIVKVPALGEKAVMADYNLWYALNGGRDDPSRDREFTDVTLDTYRAAYQAALNTNRAPLTIGTHFNDWSGGAFSDATERFMSEVCVRAHTVCTTYSQVIAWMSLQKPAVLNAFRTMPPAQVS